MSKAIIAILAVVLVAAAAGAVVLASGDGSSDEPGTPDIPDTPDTPDTPDQPDTPDTPDQPDQPDKPDTPVTPDTPDDPVKSYKATVWFDSGSTSVDSTGEGSTVIDIVKAAYPDHDIVVMANGNIGSIDGTGNKTNERWVIFVWESYKGWVVYNSQEVFDGMILAVKYSERTKTADGTVEYEKPEMEIKQRAYFFIRMSEQLDSTEWLKKLPLTEEEKKEGFWIAGEGTNPNEALADAVLSAFFPDSKIEVSSGDSEKGHYIEYIVDGEKGFFKYGTSSDMYGWFVSFLGLTDEDMGGGLWRYWVQYSYNKDAKTDDNPDSWDFNQLSFGQYDLSKYHYFALIRMITTEDGTDTYIPTPSTIPESMKK